MPRPDEIAGQADVLGAAAFVALAISWLVVRLVRSQARGMLDIP